MHMCTFVHTHIFMELVNSQPHNRKIMFFATTWRILFSVKKIKHRNINIIYSHIPDLQTWIHNFIPLSASESLKTEMEITVWCHLYLFPQYSQTQLQLCTLFYIALILMKESHWPAHQCWIHPPSLEQHRLL